MSETISNVSATRALAVSLAVAFVCALVVSTVSVGLRPLQDANAEAERRKQLESVLTALAEIGQVQTFEDLEARIVNLSNGQYDDTLDPVSFNAETAIGQPEGSIQIPADLDHAGIKRRAVYARVFLVRDQDSEIELIILPVWGKGYQSSLHAWLVLDRDTTSIAALKFYQHGETPGIGARIQEPEWEALWRGAPIYDDNGILRIGVRSRTGNASADDSGYLIDGISGATRTTQGVNGLLRFWLGDLGYGPYLQQVRED